MTDQDSPFFGEKSPGAKPYANFRGNSRYAAYDNRGCPVQLDFYKGPVTEANFRVFWNVLEVQVNQPRSRISASGSSCSKRGLTIGFSPKSQNRLAQLIRMVWREDIPYLLTFTPECNVQDSRVFKYWLKCLRRELTRKYPSASFIWRLEFQQRGAAHYHILMWHDTDRFAPRLDWLDEAWLKNTWVGITGAPDRDGRAFKYGAQLLDPMTHSDGPKILSYMAKVRKELDTLVDGHTTKGNQIRNDIHTARGVSKSFSFLVG